MQQDVSVREAEVESDGRKIKVRYHALTWLQAGEARDAAMHYERGGPRYLKPFKYAQEKLLRMLESVDGKPFEKADMMAWAPGFGDTLIKELGILRGDDAEESFPVPSDQSGEGTRTAVTDV